MSTKLPQIILSDKKGEHYGTVGSYCWNGICVSYQLPSSLTNLGDILELEKDTLITFHIKDHAKPTNFQITLFSENKIILNASVDLEINLHIPAGMYFLNAKADWQGEGDVSYLFPIKIID